MKTKLALLLPILLALMLLPARAAVRYVNVANPSPAPPHTTWASAATTIQDAIDAADAGDEIVVTNGVYATDGRAVVGMITNRVAVTKPLIVRSVNGPEVTLIRGYQVPGTTNGDGAVRCVYLAEEATLSGFTLMNGATRSSGPDYEHDQSGGGVWCATNSCVVSNCVLSGNSAGGGCGQGGCYGGGGGAYGGTLKNCTLIGNSAIFGGGVAGGTLSNCTLTGNSAYSSGGGASGGTLNDCTLSGNWAVGNGGGASGGTLNNCTITGNSAEYGGGANECTLNDCTITGNSARYGGGASGGTVNNCTITGNSAGYGGGAYYCTLDNCVLTANSATYSGGGAFYGTLYNCTITGNSAGQGGGAVGNTQSWAPGAFVQLYNCTLTGNSASFDGGGVSLGRLSGCMLAGNSAQSGGGVANSVLNNCTLSRNSAYYQGGGAFQSGLNNCTLIDNLANWSGGGVYYGTLNNCIVYYNFAGWLGDNYDSFSQLNGSCTTPLPPSGQGNFENRLRLLDLVGGDFRLQPDSTCINAGLNVYATEGIDLDGNPRIVGGTVDVGAYEFQSPQSLISYAWLQQYGLSTDGSSDNLDLDGDQSTNFQEWRSGTDPTNAFSALRLLTPEPSGPDLVLRWSSVPGRNYFLERSTNLTSSGGFMPIARNIPGQAESTAYTEPNVATNSQRSFYRVGVE